MYVCIYICDAAAAAAKSLQSCPTLCNPIDGSPPGSPSLGFCRQYSVQFHQKYAKTLWIQYSSMLIKYTLAVSTLAIS